MSDVTTVYTRDEFASEARYLDALIWEALVVVPGAKVLVCGYGPDGAIVKRAIESRANVSVIEHRDEPINRFANLGARLLRGSTSVIPAKDNSFDLAIAYHYLHEIDPFFHSQVLSELARVSRRVALVEPAPPVDPLGRRIALLYSQAKRELGQFEYYQPLEYWKKLLQGVKADVSQHVFAFGKVPPREYLADTVKLLLDTMEIEAAPKEFMEELRQIAQRSDVQLLPPPRYVFVGAAAGELLPPSFTPRLTRTPQPPAAPAAATSVPKVVPPPETPAVNAQSGYEMPPIEPRPMIPPDTIEPAPPVPVAEPQPPTPAPPPKKPAPAPQPPPAPAPAFGLNFGLPQAPPAGTPPPPAPFGMPFATPGSTPEAPGFGIPGSGPNPGWAWEPPEGEEPPLP
jgi:ubiquinone/menaquinone biosynthesis C-methylase UbiE